MAWLGVILALLAFAVALYSKPINLEYILLGVILAFLVEIYQQVKGAKH